MDRNRNAKPFPGARGRDSRSSASHWPGAGSERNKPSIWPPVVFFSMKRAGMTLESLKTNTSVGRRMSGRSENDRSHIARSLRT